MIRQKMKRLANKVHSVRYQNQGEGSEVHGEIEKDNVRGPKALEDPALSSIYLSNEAYRLLGEPAHITVQIEKR